VLDLKVLKAPKAVWVLLASWALLDDTGRWVLLESRVHQESVGQMVKKG
jgi:hypothetical protein